MRGTVTSPKLRRTGWNAADADAAEASMAASAAKARARFKGAQCTWRFGHLEPPFGHASRLAAVAGRFEGKQGLVMGVANRRSIAWAIARRLAGEGARLAFTYQGERIEKNVRELAESVSSPLVTECDVRSDTDLERVFGEVSAAFGGGLDLLVHSVAFAAAEDLEGRFAD